MQAELTRVGYLARGLSAAQRARALRELSVAPLSLQDPYPKKFKVFQQLGGAAGGAAGGPAAGLAVPRFWAEAAGWPAAGSDARAPGEAAPALAAFRGELRPALRQPEAAAAALTALRAGGGAVLSLPTGYGKTTVALWLASRLRVKTLVLVHTSVLQEQWAQRVAQYLPGARVSYVRGGALDLSGDVVIAMIQTLVSRAYPPSTFDPCGLLLVDECHHVGAEVFSRAMFGLALPMVLGLSATPERKDGLSRLVHWFLGPLAFREQRTAQANVRVRFVTYACARYAQPPPVNRRGDLCYAGVMAQLTEDAERTALVVAEAAALARAGRQVLVLSHRRAHCEALAAGLVAAGVDAATFLGARGKAAAREVPAARVVVATFQLAAEGFDEPRLDALLLATPASDVHQASGRILRGGGGADPLIVDVVDAWGVCFAQRAKRRGFYLKSGFTLDQAQAPGSGRQTDPGATGAASAQEYAFLE